MAVLLGLFVIMGVGGIAVLGGRRRAEEEPMDLATEHMPAGGAAEPVPGGQSAAAYEPMSADAASFAARIIARGEEAPRNDPVDEGSGSPHRSWEREIGLDDQPIGTVDRLVVDPQPRPWDEPPWPSQTPAQPGTPGAGDEAGLE